MAERGLCVREKPTVDKIDGATRSGVVREVEIGFFGEGGVSRALPRKPPGLAAAGKIARPHRYL